MPRTIAIIQARSGSSRLPGKVLMDIGGQTMLSRVVNRLRRAAGLDRLVVATTVEPADDAVVEACNRLNVALSRGSEEDVLDRFYRAATVFDAEIVVRITADCPLIDPAEVTRVVAAFNDQQPDYASNALVPTLPRGLDTEAIAISALATAWSQATAPYQRAHVTPFIYEHPDRFRLLSVPFPGSFGEHRWTVDTTEDLQFVREVYARFGNRDDFGWCEVIELLAREPKLSDINREIKQKSLMEG
jgi:spore coat polysaccharide biosynthesis protein SpsF